LKRPHIWLEKLDGSMINAMTKRHKNATELKFRTKMGYETSVAIEVEKEICQEKIFYDENGDFQNEEKVKENKYYNIINFCKNWLMKGYTPIFE
jgi:hypothetical protein